MQALIELGEAIENVGDLCMGLGRKDDAVDAYARLVAIRVEVHGERHLEVAKAYKKIGLVYSLQGKDREAMEAYVKCLDIELWFFSPGISGRSGEP